MKRTISHEASDAAAHLRQLGFAPGIQNGGGIPDPLTLLGLGPQAKWSEVRQAYVARLRVYHPEHHPQDFMRVVDAYDVLKRFFRSSNGATASAESDSGCFAGPTVKRRRADAAGAAGASVASPGPSAPAFAGLQECWQNAAAPAPVIALDPSGVGHIGQRDRAMPGFGNITPSATAAPGTFLNGFGSGVSSAAAPGSFETRFGSRASSAAATGPFFSSGFGIASDDDGCLARSVSNHMGSAAGCGGGFGAPLNASNSGQPLNGMCTGGQAGLFSDRGESAMMIG